MLRTLRGLPLLGCLLGSIGCHGQSPAPPSIPKGDYSAIIRYLQTRIPRDMAQDNIPGLSIALVNGQELIWARGFGMADKAKGLPVIAIDRVMESTQFCSVVSDDRQACQQLTSSLLQPLPKQIVLIGARPELSISQERTAGFKEALKDFSGDVLIEQGEAFSRDCGRQLMEQLLQSLGHLPDALVTTSYVLLQGVFDALHDFPLKSRPLRLGTFGDTQLLDFLPLPVNAMAQQHQLIADTALRLGRRPASRRARGRRAPPRRKRRSPKRWLATRISSSISKRAGAAPEWAVSRRSCLS